MHYVVMCMMISVIFAAYGAANGYTPGFAKFVPELLSGIAILGVLLAGVRNRFEFVGPRYWLVFGALAFTLLAGVVVNAMPTGPIVTGLRLYLRPIPFFFVPAVFLFSERQYRQQMLLLLILALIQVPIAIQQRIYWQGRGWITGDLVQGTLIDSGFLSIFLICVALVLCALALRGKISKWTCLLLFFIVLTPTMINETKVTVVLLPLGLLVTMIVAAAPGRRLMIGVWSILLLVAFGAIFVPVYDYLQKDRQYAVPLTEFFTEEKNVSRYVESGSEVGDRKTAGRVDSVKVPFRYLQKDASHFAFGLGMGNVSTSSLGKNFVGHYYSLFSSFTGTSAASFLLELGIFGIALLLVLKGLIFLDSLALARADKGTLGALGAACAAFVPIYCISLAYTSIHVSDCLSYLFWYFAGVVVAQRMRLAKTARVRARAEQESPDYGRALGHPRY